MKKSDLELWLDRPIRDLLATMQRRIMTQTSWFGVKALKNPLDFWVYQEIIAEQRPDVIVEIGNHTGGSALALAHLCDLADRGRVIGVDIDHSRVPQAVREHPRITFLTGDAVALHPQVADFTREADNVLIIEDSSHTFDNTLNILRTYSDLVRQGNYFIVEDSICHHGLPVGPTPGPYEAVEAFVKEHEAFEIDFDRESFIVTWNPKGFLKRVRK